jgi:atypical dual specificity phosphatase
MQSLPSLYREQLPYPLWLAVQNLPRAWLGVFRQIQFVSLLLARSYRGLIPALNWWDVIDEHFILGGALMFDDIERLQRQGIGAVINLCAERQDDLSRLSQAQMTSLWLPVIDTCAPTLAQITQGIEWIEQQLHSGRTIYIHCAAGVGRSATMLACWYMYAWGMGVQDILLFLKARHPQISPTRRQMRQLHAFAALLQQSATQGDGDGSIPI